MDIYNLQKSGKAIPRVLFRVQNIDPDFGTKVKYDVNDGFEASDPQTLHHNKYNFKRSVSKHLNWKWWGDFEPSPYISTFEDERHAKNWARKWCDRHQHDCKIFTIRTSELDNYLFRVVDLVDELGIDLNTIGRGLPRNTVKDDYLCLHRIPASAIEGSRIIRANGSEEPFVRFAGPQPTGNTKSLIILKPVTPAPPETHELNASFASPLPQIPLTASSSPYSENAASPFSEKSARSYSQSPLSMHLQNESPLYRKTSETKPSQVVTQQGPPKPPKFPEISPKLEATNSSQTRPTISPISQPLANHGFSHDPFQGSGRSDSGLRNSDTTSYPEPNNARATQIPQSSPNSYPTDIYHDPHDTAGEYSAVGNADTTVRTGATDLGQVRQENLSTSQPPENHGFSYDTVEPHSRFSANSTIKTGATDQGQSRQTSTAVSPFQGYQRFSDDTISNAGTTIRTVATDLHERRQNSTPISETRENHKFSQEPVRSNVQADSRPSHRGTASVSTTVIPQSAPDPYADFSSQGHQNAVSSQPVHEYYGDNYSQRTMSPEYRSPAPTILHARSISSTAAAYTHQNSSSHGAQPIREPDVPAASTGANGRGVHQNAYHASPYGYGQANHFPGTSNTMVPKARGGRVRRGFRCFFCMG